MSRLRLMRDARLALSMLTIVPAGTQWPRDERTQAAAWFPAIGVLFGAVAYVVLKTAGSLDLQMRIPYVIAAIIVVAWALMNRTLPWRSLARVADALVSTRGSHGRLEIPSDDRRVGAFGIAVVTLIVLLEVAAIGRIAGRPHEAAVLLVPILSHFAATAAAWLGVASPRTGLIRSALGHPTPLAFVAGVAPLAGALTGLWIGYKTVGLVLGALGLFLALGIPHVLGEWFGGLTAESAGASLLMTEVALFVALALVV